MWGLASRYDRMKSEALFVDAVDEEESSQRLFSNIETKPSEHWTLNAGVIVEYNEIVNQYASYRLSANYHINPNHTLRVAYNDGESSPGLYEANQQNIFTRAGHVLNVGTVAPDTLTSQEGTLVPDDLTTETVSYTHLTLPTNREV